MSPCEICEYGTVIDRHHWSEKEASYLCPNCYSIISRFLEQNQTNPEWKKQTTILFEPYSPTDTDEDWKKNVSVPSYIKIAMYAKKEEMLNAVRRIRNGNFQDILNNSDTEDHYADGKFNHCQNKYKFQYHMGINENCNVCDFKLTIDTHHFGEKTYNRPSVSLCPNHHAILHRKLKDYDGTKFNSKKEIIEAIIKCENGVENNDRSIR